MFKYILRKLVALLPKLLAMSIILFFALELLPGDALSRTMPPDQYQALSEAQKDAAREALGLNDSPVIRYFRWLNQIFHGDFGYSASTGQNIGTMLAGRLPYTIELSFYGLLLATVIGLVLGFLSAFMKNTVVDYFCTSISVFGISAGILLWHRIHHIVFRSSQMAALRRPYAGRRAWLFQPGALSGAARHDDGHFIDCRACTLHKKLHAGCDGKGLYQDGQKQGPSGNNRQLQTCLQKFPDTDDDPDCHAPAPSCRRIGGDRNSVQLSWYREYGPDSPECRRYSCCHDYHYDNRRDGPAFQHFSGYRHSNARSAHSSWVRS